MIKAKRWLHFRSRTEARWAVFFDSLEVEWVYEFWHYEFGLKHPWLQDNAEFREYLQEALDEAWGDEEEEEEIIRSAYRYRYERNMYLPDFWLPDFEHWVEIKGKSPTWEEQQKARSLASRTRRPCTILWGHIFPDPQKPDAIWGDCTEIYGGDMNIIAVLASEFSIKSMDSAFAAARHARFKEE